MKPEPRQSVQLIAVLAAAGLAIALVSIGLFYRVSIHQQGLRLLGTARDEARMIEAMAAHEMQRPGADTLPGNQGGSFEAVISQLRAAKEKLTGFGRTGELQIGQLDNDSIVYLVARGGFNLVRPSPVFLGGQRGQPMYRAVTGRSGNDVLRDYRGVKVLAGYEPVKVFGLGVVAEIDLNEVQAPFVKADIIVLVATLVFVVIGGLLLLVVTAPGLQRLRESEERFRVLFENSPLGVLLYEVQDDDRLLLVGLNTAVERILGNGYSAQVGRPFEGVFPSVIGTELPATYRRVARTGEPWQTEQFDYKDERISGVFEIRAFQFGKNRVAVMFDDITERKQAEEEKERLAREVERRKVELEQLIYAASHDLRTPLVSVQGFVGELRLSLRELLAELDRPDLPPEFRQRIAELAGSILPESLRFIDAGTARMGTLLTGLLRLSRLGRATFQSEPLDMNRVVGEAVRSLEFAAREAGAKVEVADLPACLGDPMQMGQVFANLIENAFKYRSPDRALLIRITGRREDGKAVYCVEDNGIGLAPDQQERVFAPFFRVDATVPGGEGLGLTIVTRIVERLGGRAWVESELEKGSRFFVALPVGE